MPHTGPVGPVAGQPPPLGLLVLQPVGSGVWHCDPDVGSPFAQLPTNAPLPLPLPLPVAGLPALWLFVPGVPLFPLVLVLPFPAPLAARVVLANPVGPEFKLRALVARTRARHVAPMSSKTRFMRLTPCYQQCCWLEMLVPGRRSCPVVYSSVSHPFLASRAGWSTARDRVVCHENEALVSRCHQHISRNRKLQVVLLYYIDC